MQAIDHRGGKSHVPPSPEPDVPGDVPGQDPPGQDDDPLLAPLQERKERDAHRHLREEGPQHRRVPPPGRSKSE